MQWELRDWRGRVTGTYTTADLVRQVIDKLSWTESGALETVERRAQVVETTLTSLIEVLADSGYLRRHELAKVLGLSDAELAEDNSG